jgi:DNA-binding transcriptional LysR family regulator
MDRFNAMRTFVLVVDQGSFAGAARKLDSDQALVSRQVAALEKHLKVKLLERTTRSMRLTEAGELYLARSRDILANLEEAEAQVSQSHVAMEGRVRLAVPTLFGKAGVACQLAAARAEHPRLQIDVAMLDRAVDPVAEGFDVVIADANLPVPSSAIARPVLTVPLLLCAAPAYLAKAGVPSHPADLQGMDAVTQWQVGDQGGANEGWTLHHQDGSVFEVTLPAAMRANNYALSLEGVVRGLGVGRFTPRMLSEDLAQGTVQRILPDWTAGALSFNMIYPSRRLVPVRVRTFIDSMVAQFDSFARQRAI